MLRKAAGPLIPRWQRCRIRDVTAFSELDYLPLALDILDHSKCSVREVHVTLSQSVHATCPTDRVHEATLVTIGVRYTECVDKAVLERCKALAECFVEAVVEL